MLAEITKAFAQTFLIGHLLPAILFVAFAKYVLGMTENESLTAFLEGLKAADNAVDIGVLGLILALLLTTMNRQLIQIFEGYSLGRAFTIRFKIPHPSINERRRFDELTKKLSEAETGRSKIQYALAMGFPERRDLVLPTRFGNVIRAFERYSSVAYGFEAIEGSNRLSPLVAESASNAIAWSRSKLDFWINVSFLALIAPFVWWWGTSAPSAAAIALALVIGLAAALAAIYIARYAAYEWGVNVKASIDLTLPRLAETLGYEVPLDATQQREFWTRLSQHFLLRDDRTLQMLQPYRRKETPKKPKKE